MHPHSPLGEEGWGASPDGCPDKGRVEVILRVELLLVLEDQARPFLRGSVGSGGDKRLSAETRLYFSNPVSTLRYVTV